MFVSLLKWSPRKYPSDTILSDDNIVDFLFHFTELMLCQGPEMFFKKIFYTEVGHTLSSQSLQQVQGHGVLGGGGAVRCDVTQPVTSHSPEGGRSTGGGVRTGSLGLQIPCSQLLFRNKHKTAFRAEQKFFHGSGISVHGPLLSPRLHPHVGSRGSLAGS